MADTKKFLKINKEGFAKDDDGKDVFSFNVTGVLRGKQVLARLKMDKFAYHQHEFVFGGEGDNYDVYLEYRPKQLVDSRTGTVTIQDNFVAVSYDEGDDVPYEMPMQPFGKFDTTILLQLFKRSGASAL